MMNNPWNLPNGTKLRNKFGCEFTYVFSQCYEKWMLENRFNCSMYELDQPYFTERHQFEVVDSFSRDY